MADFISITALHCEMDCKHLALRLSGGALGDFCSHLNKSPAVCNPEDVLCLSDSIWFSVSTY